MRSLLARPLGVVLVASLGLLSARGQSSPWCVDFNDPTGGTTTSFYFCSATVSFSFVAPAPFTATTIEPRVSGASFGIHGTLSTSGGSSASGMSTGGTIQEVWDV